jgi:hypothetical protein
MRTASIRTFWCRKSLRPKGTASARWPLRTKLGGRSTRRANTRRGMLMKSTRAALGPARPRRNGESIRLRSQRSLAHRLVPSPGASCGISLEAQDRGFRTSRNREVDWPRDALAMSETTAELSSIERFYLRLFTLQSPVRVEPLIEDALQRIVEVTTSELAYVEFFDDPQAPTFWRGYATSLTTADAIRARVARSYSGGHRRTTCSRHAVRD